MKRFKEVYTNDSSQENDNSATGGDVTEHAHIDQRFKKIISQDKKNHDLSKIYQFLPKKLKVE
jgi:hypothetical protein